MSIVMNSPAFRLRPDATMTVIEMSSLTRIRRYAFTITLAFLVIMMGLIGWSKTAIGLLGVVGSVTLFIASVIGTIYFAKKQDRADERLRELRRQIDRDFDSLAELLGRTSNAILAMSPERLRDLAKEVMTNREQALKLWTLEFKDYSDQRLSAFAMNNLLVLIEDHQQLLQAHVEEARDTFQEFGLIER